MQGNYSIYIIYFKEGVTILLIVPIALSSVNSIEKHRLKTKRI